MSRELPVLSKADAARRLLFAYKNPELRQALLKLLAIKDSDIRILTLEQCRDATKALSAAAPSVQKHEVPRRG